MHGMIAACPSLAFDFMVLLISHAIICALLACICCILIVPMPFSTVMPPTPYTCIWQIIIDLALMKVELMLLKVAIVGLLFYSSFLVEKVMLMCKYSQ